MSIEQTLLTRLVVKQRTVSQEASYPKQSAGKLPETLAQFVEQTTGTAIAEQGTLIVEKADQLTQAFAREQEENDSFPQRFILLQRVNDIRYINKFLESVNESLPTGGYLVGSVETSISRKQRILSYLPRPVRQPYYLADFMITRVWPKLPHLRKLYFGLTRGKNRVISEMEAYGRLYSCGFKIENTTEYEGRIYFVAKKVALPDYNTDPTYGPLIRLNRFGKNGKMIKVLKFRTMSPYSEYLQAYIYEQQGLQEGGKFKDDPRVNTLGRFMRKYWLDELPMIINLLRGDMKLFGVRPLSNHFMSLYPKDFQEYRKKFKPGLFPPFYVDMPKTLEEIVDSERRYLEAYERRPWLTDARYFYKSLYNIFIKQARSK